MLIDTIKEYTTQKILILGIGSETTQFLEWAIKVARLDPKIFILADQHSIKTDILEKTGFFDTNTGFSKPQTFFGEDYLKSLEEESVELVIKSPGIWSLKPELVHFRKRKGEDSIISSLHFFFEKYKRQIIGVTGTKGKTTTSGLIAHILNSLPDYEAVHCGNSTNISPFRYWQNFSQDVDPQSYFVIELSSFQLQDLHFSQISPHRSVITNYYIDHLDQHSTVEEYWHAKDAIFLHQTKPCLITTTDVPKFTLSRATKVIEQADATSTASTIDFPLLGKHNDLNTTLALTMIAHVVNTNLQTFIANHQAIIEKSLNSFKNFPFRFALTRTVHTTIPLDSLSKKLTIRFINDGAATESQAVTAALEAVRERNMDFLWVQFSGKDKGGSVDSIIELLLRIQQQNRLYRVNYCGDIGRRILSETYRKMKVPIEASPEKLKDTLKNEFSTTLVLEFSSWLQELIDNFRSIGQESEAACITQAKEIRLTILLSPCGSSFDEFNNYIERSKYWDETVHNIPLHSDQI